MYSGKAKIISNEFLSADTLKLSVQINDSVEIKPGQFAMIGVGSSAGMLLKRPISIHSFDKDIITFIYTIKGKGTKELSSFKPDEELDILLPLGNGFPSINPFSRVVLIGGGMGAFPLFSLFKQNKDVKFYSYLGFRNQDCILLQKEFSEYSEWVRISTDDGSACIHDCITNVLEYDIKSLKPDMILACGPHPMLKALSQIVDDIPTFVSMEEKMACGFGACLVCACKTTAGNKRTCKEGPVFNIKEVVL